MTVTRGVLDRALDALDRVLANAEPRVEPRVFGSAQALQDAATAAHTDADGAQWDLEDRHALRRVIGLSTELEDVFFALPHHRLTENPLEDDELHRMTDDGYIDVTEPVREHVLMAIPIDPISPAYRDSQQAQASMNALLGDDAAEWLKVNWSDKNQGSL